MAIRRRSQFRNRINKMQGLPIDEKMMLLRMGEIIDGAINQRAPTNPNSDRGRPSGKIPVPTNLQAQVSARGAVLSWNKVNFNNLLNYRIRISPVGGDDGEELTVTSYTNQYLFKGRAGTYRFEVQTIARNGQAGNWAGAVNFSVEDSPMILEGNKVNPEEVSTYLFETVLTPENYTVFAFTSVVMAGLSDTNDNPSITVQLRYGSTLSTSILVQEFDMYPETEDLTSNGVSSITRPSGTPGRDGVFESPQSVMFTPFQITTEDTPSLVDKQTTFWIVATGRDDVVGMSCAVWVASEGLSESDTADEGTPLHTKCLQLPKSSGNRRGLGVSEDRAQDEGDTFIDDIWSFALWVKPSSLSTDIELFARYATTGLGSSPSNECLIFIDWLSSTNTLDIEMRDTAGTTAVHATYVSRAKVWPLGVNNWHLLVVTFNGTRSGSKINVYINGTEITANTDNSSSSTISVSLVGFSFIYVIGMAPVFGSGNSLLSGIFDTTNWLLNGRVHMAGLWDVVLAPAAVASIYNSGFGATRDWLSSFGNYANNLDLRHHWRFGALDNDLVGPPDPANPNKYFKYATYGAGSSPALQGDIDNNRSRDVAFDIGNMQEEDGYGPGETINRGIDFTNGLFVAGDVGTYGEDRVCTILSRAVLGDTQRPGPSEIIEGDYPGA